MNGSEDHDLLIEMRTEFRGMRQFAEEEARRNTEWRGKTDLRLDTMNGTQNRHDNDISLLLARPMAMMGLEDVEQHRQMYGLYNVFKYLIPFLFLLQPTIIWAVAKLTE